jgi:hypothetical protein
MYYKTFEVQLVKHVYCTYFDHNYLPRALLMLQSLRSVDPETPIFILALSDLCETVLRRIVVPGVTIIPLSSLEATFAELPRLKSERKRVEYFFTLTPFLPLHVFDTTDAQTVTYIDADLYFYADPRPMLASIGAASIAITPNRFSPEHAADAQYGRFNVGWMTFQRDREGLACLVRYRDDCVAWCYDRVEDGRFADQGYLDTWPDRYASLSIIEHKGVNLAQWNVDNYTLQERDGQISVDGDPLIFYHFHGIRCNPDGSFNLWLPRSGAEGSAPLRCLYHPYMTQLIRCRAELHQEFPAIEKAAELLRLGDVEAATATGPSWHHDGIHWPATGFDTAQLKSIVELHAALTEARSELSRADERSRVLEAAAAERLAAMHQKDAVIVELDAALTEARAELSRAAERSRVLEAAAVERLAAMHNKDSVIAELDAALTEARAELSRFEVRLIKGLCAGIRRKAHFNRLSQG